MPAPGSELWATMPAGQRGRELEDLLRLGNRLEPMELIAEEVRLKKSQACGKTESLSRLQLAPRPGEVFGRTMTGTLHPGVPAIDLKKLTEVARQVGLARIERWQLEVLLSAALTNLDAISPRKR